MSYETPESLLARLESMRGKPAQYVRREIVNLLFAGKTGNMLDYFIEVIDFERSGFTMPIRKDVH